MQKEFGDVVETQPVNEKKTFDDTAATATVYGQDRDSDVQWCEGRAGTPKHLEPRGNSGLVANLAPIRDDEGRFGIGFAWFTANYGENKRREEGELLTFHSPRGARRNPSSRDAKSWKQYVVDDGPWWGPLVPAVLNKGGFFEVVTRFKRGIYETIVPYDFLCSQYGDKRHSMEALHGILWKIISRVGAGVLVEPSSAEHECSTQGWARDAQVSKGEGCTVDALDDDKYTMEFKLRTGGKHDAGDERSKHGRGRKAALPKFCAMTCAAEASTGDVRISPLAPSNYRRTCKAVQNLVTALAGAANYADTFFQFLANGSEDAKILKRLKFYTIATCDLENDSEDTTGSKRFHVDLSKSRSAIKKAVKRAYTEPLRRHKGWVAEDPENKLPDDFFELQVSDKKKRIFERRAAAAAAAARPKRKKRRSAPPPPPQLRELMWADAVKLLRKRIESGAGPIPVIDESSDDEKPVPVVGDDSVDAPDESAAMSDGELVRRARELKVLSAELLEALEEAHPELDFEPDGRFGDMGPGQLADTMAVASERLEKSLVKIKKRAEQDSESEDDSEQPEFEGNDGSDDDDDSDDDDAPAPRPAAPMEESSSDDDEQMAPAPPRAPRKRSRAGSRPEQPRGDDDDESVPPAKNQPSLKAKLKKKASPGKPARRRGV